MSLKREVPDDAKQSSGGPLEKTRRINPSAHISSAHGFVQAVMNDDNFQTINSVRIHAAMKNMPHPYTPHTFDVVIRDDDYQFWRCCIDELEDPKKRNRLAVVGTPGIGKTTTSFFAIRMLLKAGKKVVYLYRTVDKSYPYIQMTPEPGTDNVTIDHFPGSTLATDIPALLEQATFYIVDPGQTKANCNPEGRVMAKVIIVASPDERQWGANAFEKREPGRDPGFFRYFPPWSPRQLATGAGFIDSVSSSAAEIEELYTLFGGIPRMVYNPDEKDTNVTALERKVNELDIAELKKLLAGRGSIHVGFGQDHPKGGIVVFKPTDNFSKVGLEAASDKVLELIRVGYMDIVWDDLATYGSPIAWQLLESYVSEALHGTRDYTTRPCVGKSDNLYSQEDTASIGGCTSRSLQSDCTAAVRDGDDLVLYYSSNRFHPLYDMIFNIGNIYFAFQVTVGKKHKASKAEIKKVVAALGICSGGPELRLFYSVHEGVFDEFVTEPVVPFAPPGMSIHHLKIGRGA